MWHAVPVGAGLGSECREKWLCTWGGCVLDQVGCSWRCWRHPDASGVGVKVTDHHSRRAPWEALGDFIQGGSGRVLRMRPYHSRRVAPRSTELRHVLVERTCKTSTSDELMMMCGALRALQGS